MQKLILGILFILLSTQVYALSGTTKGGHTACLKKQWLNDVIDFVAADDIDSFQAYIDSRKCIILKKGLRVTVTDSPGMFGGTVEFIFKGTRFWTVREALEYGD